MRTLIFLTCLLSSWASFAQNYRCLQTGVKQYYINGNGYLRGIRVDSTRTYGDTTYYFLFHTPRGRSTYPTVLDSMGSSWVGNKVRSTGDGIYLFNNWIDTVVIKSQAGLSDSWVFYNDSSDLYYKATVIGWDTMSVAGFTDSVKTIEITAHKPAGPVTSDSVNGFRILLSKSHGFVQVFDLYTFPYHKPDSSFHPGMDFYLDKSTTSAGEAYSSNAYAPRKQISEFKIIDLVNPTNRQLYDFNIGDIYQYKECVMADGFACDFSYMGEPVTNSFVQTDTIIGKTVGAGSTVYDFAGAYSYPNPFYIHSVASHAMSVDDTRLIDTTIMPEEYKQKNVYYYSPFGNSYCLVSPEYDIVPNYLNGINAPFYFEGPVVKLAYKMGLGQVYNYMKEAGASYFTIESSQLVYYKTSVVTCGTPLKIKQFAVGDKLLIYPNPTSNTLHIECNDQIRKLVITDMIGRLLFAGNYNNKEVAIDLSEFVTGSYLIRINDREVRRFTKL